MCYALGTLKTLFSRNYRHNRSIGGSLYLSPMLLLRNILKIGCQSMRICYNKDVATENQQARIIDVIEVKNDVHLHKT